MMFKLLKYNLKKQRKHHMLIPIFLGIILSLSMKNMINTPNHENIFFKDIFTFIYGGVSIDINENFSLLDIIRFLTPHIVIIYLAEIYFTDLIKSTPRNMFLRIPSIKKWISSINISLFYIIIKYYIILYTTSMITIMVYVKRPSLNIFNFSNITSNDISIVIQIMILSILTVFLINMIGTNIYFIFNKNDKPILIFILFNIISTLFTGFGEKFNLFIIINHLMIKRHAIFKEGYSSLTLIFSLVYLSLIIILSIASSKIIIKKLDF